MKRILGFTTGKLNVFNTAGRYHVLRSNLYYLVSKIDDVMIRAFSVSDGSDENIKINKNEETVLSGFTKTDPVVTILGLELNTSVYP